MKLDLMTPGPIGLVMTGLVERSATLSAAAQRAALCEDVSSLGSRAAFGDKPEDGIGDLMRAERASRDTTNRMLLTTDRPQGLFPVTI